VQKLPGIQLQIIGIQRESVNFVKTVSEQSAVSEWNMIVPVYMLLHNVRTLFGVVEKLERSWRNVEANEDACLPILFQLRLICTLPSFIFIHIPSQH
jgi:hypothetical protein